MLPPLQKYAFFGAILSTRGEEIAIVENSPLNRYFEVVASPDYHVLGVFMPQAVHVDVVNFDDRVAGFQARCFRRRAPIYLKESKR